MLIPRVKDVFDLQLFAEGGQEPPASGTGAAGANESIGGDADKAKTYDETYVKKLRNESANYRNKYKELETSMNQKFTDFQANIFKAIGIDPDPNKAYEKQISDWKGKAVEAEARANEKLIRAEVKMISSQLGIVNPDIAYKLIKDDLASIKIKDNGDVEGIKEVLEGLLKANPFLRGQSRPIGGPTNPGGSQQLSDTTAQKMNAAIRAAAGFFQ